MPAGPPFRISWQLCAFISPVAEFSAWTGAFGDIDVRRPSICDPPVPANGSGERSMRRPKNP